MATEKQILANRANAARSTGPRSVEGKAISGLNALRHGVLSARLILPDEDTAEFESFASAVRNDLCPEGEAERFLVDLVVSYAWRLGRVMRAERGVLVRDLDRLSTETEESHRAASQPGILNRTVGSRSESIDARDGMKSDAWESTSESGEAATSGDSLLGLTFMRCGEALTRLTRYEAHISRHLFRALEELRRLQAKRLSRDDDIEGQERLRLTSVVERSA